MDTPPAPAGADADPAAAPAGLVRSWTLILAAGLDCGDDGQRVELLRALEELKCAAEAAQARTAVALDTSVRAAEAAAGRSADRQGRGVAGQVGLARRCSPHRARQLLGLAKIVTVEMPHTAAAWRAGRIGEWRASVLARQTATLPLPVRQRIDAELAGTPDAVTRLERMSDRQTAAAALSWACRLDPAAVADRRRHAETQRRVTTRPAPDTMTWTSALLPVADGVAVHAALTKAADTARAAGDPRTRGQVMADTLVQRVTGRTTGTHDIVVNLVISDHTLFSGSHEPARIPGHGPLPADHARDLIIRTLHHSSRAGSGEDDGPQVFIRRLLTDPAGHLVAMESTRRLAPTGLAHFITLRDQTCRTPWCDAPIRHIDHITPADQGGPTTAANLQGLCEACNHTKTAPGWQAQPIHGTGHRWTVETITPTKHAHRTHPDPWPTPPPAKRSTPTRRRSDNPRPLTRLHARPSPCEYLLQASLYVPAREAAPNSRTGGRLRVGGP